jgi:hypothetical protein
VANGDLKRGDGQLLKKAKSCEVVFDPAELESLRKVSQQQYDDMMAKMEVGRPSSILCSSQNWNTLFFVDVRKPFSVCWCSKPLCICLWSVVV